MEESTTSDVGKISVLKVRDPRLDIRADREYVAMMGASMISTRRYKADSFDNASAIWSITTPSVRVGMDRRVEIEATYTITCKKVNPANDKAQIAFASNPEAGLRQYPLHSVLRNVEGQLNNQAFSGEFSRVIHSLLKFGNDVNDRQYFMGASPHMPDVSTSYTGLVGTRSPFTSYYNVGQEDPRGLPEWTNVTVGQTDIEFTIREPLMLPPFHFGQGDVQALFGIQQFDLTLTFEGLSRMLAGTANGWVRRTAGIYGTDDVNNVGNFDTLRVDAKADSAYLHITYLTPPPDWKIPRVLHYPFYTINKLTSKPQAITNGGASSYIETPAINRNDISRRLYLAVVPQINFNANADAGSVGGAVVTPNFWGRIDKVNMSFDNQDGRLANFDMFDFYKINTKNTLNSSWLEATKYLGSPLCLEFGTDLNLNPLLAAGVRGTFNYGARVDFTNISATNYWFELYSVFIPEGVFTIDDQLCSFDIATLTEQTLADAPFAPVGFRVHVRNYTGSGFFSNLWNALKKGFKKVAPIARKVAEGVGSVASMIPHPYAQAVGVGANVANKALQLAGGRRKGRSRSRKRGGALIRTSSLADRL